MIAGASLTATVVTAGAIVGALTVIAGAVARAWRTPPVQWVLKHVREEAREREEERIEAVVARLVSPMLARIMAELTPNGGSSTRDKVDRLAREFDEHRAEVRAFMAKVEQR